MPNPHKLKAKVAKAEAKAERNLVTIRSKAERKIAKIRETLHADEAKITAQLESHRQKVASKLARVETALDQGPDQASRRATSKKRSSAARP
ncbi:MAG: hypothetical protein ABR606_18510 [Vicinamibacterales bacterium]